MRLRDCGFEIAICGALVITTHKKILYPLVMGGGVFSEWLCELMTRFSFWGYFIAPFGFYVIL